MKPRRRVARTRHRCYGNDPNTHRIQPGDVYLEHTTFPGLDDMGYATAAGRPIRSAECADCAQRYGRGHLLNPPPTAKDTSNA